MPDPHQKFMNARPLPKSIIRYARAVLTDPTSGDNNRRVAHKLLHDCGRPLYSDHFLQGREDRQRVSTGETFAEFVMGDPSNVSIDPRVVAAAQAALDLTGEAQLGWSTYRVVPVPDESGDGVTAALLSSGPHSQRGPAAVEGTQPAPSAPATSLDAPAQLAQ